MGFQTICLRLALLHPVTTCQPLFPCHLWAFLVSATVLKTLKSLVVVEYNGHEWIGKKTRRILCGPAVVNPSVFVMGKRTLKEIVSLWRQPKSETEPSNKVKYWFNA